MKRDVHVVLILTVCLTLMAAAAIALDMWAWQGRRVEGITCFQKAMGGLGTGAIATPIWQFLNYDVRVFSVDDSITWPIPGGYSFGPDRTGTVSYFEEIPEDQWIISRH